MTQRERELLLQEILDGEDATSLRDATLAAGLRAMRFKRRRRVAAYLSVLALPWVLLLHPTHDAKPVVTESTPTPATPKVESISTEELFALFPNRPLALVSKPGGEELVFLDQVARATR